EKCEVSEDCGQSNAERDASHECPPAGRIGGRDTSTASARSLLWSRSAALPVGLALLEEGAHALLEVLAQIARQDDVLGIAECRGARDPTRGLLHGGQRQGCQLG